MISSSICNHLGLAHCHGLSSEKFKSQVEGQSDENKSLLVRMGAYIDSYFPRKEEETARAWRGVEFFFRSLALVCFRVAVVALSLCGFCSKWSWQQEVVARKE